MGTAASESRGRFDGGPRFTVLGELGSGGTGTVYEAIDAERGARVAIKALRAFSPERLLQLKHEFRVLADMNHPNLVILGDLLEHSGQCFFTMELVPGSDFVTYVRADGAPPLGAETEPMATMRSGEQARRVPARDVSHELDEAKLRASLAQLASALAAVHSAGLLHLDVKSSNVRVTPDGRVVLLDFGLASDVRAESSRAATHGPRGTPAYVAPELAIGGPVGAAADWYSMGVVLYRALTGAFPYEGDAMEVLRAKQYIDPEPPDGLVSGIPRDLALLCRELLARAPEARPTGAEVLARLGVHAGGADVAPPPFVGRGAELAALEEALLSASRGAGASVIVTGESGIGKTALVQRFVHGAQGRSADVLVLGGRCHERESGG